MHRLCCVAGTIFLDLYTSRANLQLTSPRTVLLNRYKFIEQLNNLSTPLSPSFLIPKYAHLYTVPYSPTKLHPSFDPVLCEILLQDPLGVIFILELGNKHVTWQDLLIKRLSTRCREDLLRKGRDTTRVNEIMRRIVFPTPVTPLDLAAILQISHVVLEPFPCTGGLEHALQALAIGIPVVTLPHPSRLAGRLTYLLYTLLDYGHRPHYTPFVNASVPNTSTALYSPLVVENSQQFVQIAVKVATNRTVRDFHVQELLTRRDNLFRVHVNRLLNEWRDFLERSVCAVKKIPGCK